MLKLNIGFNRKTGEANYGSRGACVNLELELDSGLVGDPDRLKERIRQLFVLAKASVDEELAASGTTPSETSHGNGTTVANGSTGNGYANSRRRDNTRRATASQVRALASIAERRQLDLAGLLAERFATRDATELSIVEASGLIDELKGAGNGVGGRR